MSILEAIATWLLTQLLNYLLGKATQAVSDAQEQLKRDQTNAANQKAYDDATTRASRVTSALALLNGSSP